MHRQKCRSDFTDQLHDCNDWQMFRAFQTDSIKWNNIPSPPTHPPTPQKMSGVYSLIRDNNKQINCFDVTICFYLMTDKKRLDYTESMTVAKTETRRVWTLQTDSMQRQTQNVSGLYGLTPCHDRDVPELYILALRHDRDVCELYGLTSRSGRDKTCLSFTGWQYWQRHDVCELNRLTVLTETRRVWT